MVGVDVGPVWHNGNLVSGESATLHVLSHAVQRGTAVFDVLRIVETPGGRCAFGLREHVARFVRGMGLMGMTPETSISDLEQAVQQVAAANPGQGVIKLVAAWAEVPLKAMPVSTTPNIWVASMSASTAADTPLAVRTAVAPKLSADVLPPSLKVAASYTVGVREKMSALQEGFDDVIFRTVGGDVAEGTTQSLFVVVGGRIVVPPLDAVLDGITRRMVLDVSDAIGVPSDVRPIAWDEVLQADELFLCSTNQPVGVIGRHDGRELVAPGPVSSQLSDEVRLLLDGVHDRSARWLTQVVAG